MEAPLAAEREELKDVPSRPPLFSRLVSQYNLANVKTGHYTLRPPLIKPSKLATVDKGGIGKDLSEGWAINFAIGCTHACIFCYADSLHRRHASRKLGFQNIPWGFYFFVPENINEAISNTHWEKWRGKEVLMSSTHDPYLPQLAPIARKILKHALPRGVKFCIQTRSPLVLKDLDLLAEYKDQIRVQVSIATFNHALFRKIEPRVPPPQARMRILKKVKEKGIETGVIIAPVFPPVRLRPNVKEDLKNIFTALAEVSPDHIYGEMLHPRGANLRIIEEILGERFSRESLLEYDKVLEEIFTDLLTAYHLKGQWWPEHRRY